MSKVDQQFLREYFEYRDGHLWWVKKSSKYSNVKIGSLFGRLDTQGYRTGRVFNKDYKEHRLIWLYHYNEWPKENIDHINGVRDDNKIENLRECSQLENSKNRLADKNSTSKYKGVSWRKSKNRWISYICSKGKNIYLGSFTDEIEAAKAYDTKVKELHGKYGRLNFGQSV